MVKQYTNFVHCARLVVILKLFFFATFADAKSDIASINSFDETSRQIQVLYQSEQFSSLEEAINALVFSTEKFSSGKPKASAVYWAFRQQMPAPGVDINEIERIRRWRGQVPLSPYTDFAESRYWYALAWNARGNGFSNNVTNKSWQAFNTNLLQAEKVLLESSASLKGTPLWHHLLLAIAQDSEETKSNANDVLVAAALKWPQYYDLYELRLTRLVPKWGGDWQTVDTFIAAWTNKQFDTEGRSLYARLYISMQIKNPVPVNEIRLHWNELKNSFNDLIKRYPDPKFKNLFASYACLVGDKIQYRKSISALNSKELNANDWLPEASAANCTSLNQFINS
ncbi:MAG: DUF4034 domain-containing protein [Burkholderiaceae bacterium]|nr:DUF4034 domain-containing protein [Burkholderiaceae bacterium]